MNTSPFLGKASALLMSVCLLGTSCTLPQRAHSILPPTSERDLCRDDRRFYYTPVFDLCFRYAEDGWSDVTASPLTTVPGTGITSINFFLPENDRPTRVFTLYVTGITDHDRQWFQEAGITLIQDEQNYLIGYASSPTLPPVLEQRVLDIPKMMDSLKTFTPVNR